MKVLFDAFQALNGGQMPERMDTVSDGLVHLVGALVRKWIQGDKDIAPVIDSLLAAAQNPDDALMRDLSFMQRQAILQGVGALLNIQEEVRAQREKAKREEEEARERTRRAGGGAAEGA